jgi:hypothetical protein
MVMMPLPPVMMMAAAVMVMKPRRLGGWGE